MLLQLQTFHVCPLAEQQRNMCPITEWERMDMEKPRLFVRRLKMKTLYATRLIEWQTTAPHVILFGSTHLSGYREWLHLHLPVLWNSSTRFIMISWATCVRVRVKREGASVCVVIYDAVLVINMVLLSHLDAMIDTRSGQHMGWELELEVGPFPYGKLYLRWFQCIYCLCWSELGTNKIVKEIYNLNTWHTRAKCALSDCRSIILMILFLCATTRFRACFWFLFLCAVWFDRRVRWR